jgi:hypothetical protein
VNGPSVTGSPTWRALYDPANKRLSPFLFDMRPAWARGKTKQSECHHERCGAMSAFSPQISAACAESRDEPLRDCTHLAHEVVQSR